MLPPGGIVAAAHKVVEADVEEVSEGDEHGKTWQSLPLLEQTYGLIAYPDYLA